MIVSYCLLIRIEIPFFVRGNRNKYTYLLIREFHISCIVTKHTHNTKQKKKIILFDNNVPSQ